MRLGTKLVCVGSHFHFVWTTADKIVVPVGAVAILVTAAFLAYLLGRGAA